MNNKDKARPIEAEVVVENDKQQKKQTNNRKQVFQDQVLTKYSNGVFLIFLGTVFLLNSIGVIPWGAWLSLIKFWPILLIFAGLNIMFGRNRIVQWFLLILSIFVWIALITYLLYQYTDIKIIKDNYTLNQISNRLDLSVDGSVLTDSFKVTKESYPNVSEIDLDLDFAAGTFKLSDKVLDDNFLEVESQYTKNYGELDIRLEDLDEKLSIDIEQKEGKSMLFRGLEDVKYEIVTDSSTPLNINSNIDAGRGTIELIEEKVKGLVAKVSAGDLQIKLGSENVDLALLQLEIGAGQITLDLPDDLGYEIDYDLGAGSIKTGENEIGGFGKNGIYRSSNYDEATYRVTVSVKVGAGQLVIN